MKTKVCTQYVYGYMFAPEKVHELINKLRNELMKKTDYDTQESLIDVNIK